MYAIFEAKGKQFRAEPEATLRVPSLDAEPGDRVTFDHVLLAQREDQVIIGRPSLDGAAVAAEVVRHGRDDKIVVYKMKRRKGYRRKQGHRQGFTEVRVVDIDLGAGESAKAARPKAKKQAPAAKAAKPKVEAKAEPVETAAPVEAEVEVQPAGEAAEAAKEAEVLVTDTARDLAAEAGIDLSSIDGTGKDGRILKSDVQKAIKKRDEA
jgi:large subunit ribosomal protein L21